MICSECNRKSEDIVVFNNADDKSKVCICKECMNAKVDKGKLSHKVDKTRYRLTM